MNREMAQLAARRDHTPKVAGSSPALATVLYRCMQRFCVCFPFLFLPVPAGGDAGGCFLGVFHS